MTREELLLAIGELPDRMIAEAEHPAAQMRRARTWRTIAIAAALMVLLCASALAAVVLSGGGTLAYTSFFPNYFNVPSRQTLLEDIGIETNVLEEFSNGFRFRAGYITHFKDDSGDGSEPMLYDGLHCEYKLGRERVDLTVEGGPADSTEKIDTTEVYGGCEVKYYAYLNKFLPEGYQFTEQDLADKASGKYIFSYGTSEVEIDAVQQVYWQDAGLNYSICVLNSELTEAELLQMAREVIDHQK